MGLLNACGSFFIPAMASSAFNVCCILAGIFLSPIMPRLGLHPVVSMAIGALVGGASQFLVMIPSAHGFGFRYRFALDLKEPGLRHMAKLMLPAVVGLSATQINITVDLQIASAYGNGPVSWLNYAFRLVHLPVGVFGIAIATATMAAVSHLASQNAHDELHRTVETSLKLAACLTFPAMVGLIIFRHEIVQLLYQRGSFLSADTLKTEQAVLCYALGLYSYAAVKILVPTLYALNDTRTPARLSLLSVAVKIALNLIFIIPLGFLGLALATAFSSWLNCCFLARRLLKHRGVRWSIRKLQAYTRIALASLSMGVLARLVYHGSAWMLPGSSVLILAARLGLAITFGLIFLLPLFRLFRIEEGSELFRLIGTLVRKVS
jgi:putative peptidoglycan lipid II flippase